MEVMMHNSHRTGSSSAHSRGLPTLEYSEDTAHTVEVQREVDERGELGSFGFTLLYEKPPIVGTVVPGGPAEKAGLKKNEVVVAVNGQDTTQCLHQEVVSIIFNTATPGVWLTVCDPVTNEHSTSNQHHVRSSHNNLRVHDRLSFSRVRSLGDFSMSQSTPIIPRHIMEQRNPYATDDIPPPKYTELPQFQRSGSSNLVGQRAINSSVTNISPLKRKVLTQSFQQPNGQSNLQVQMSNGHGISDQSLYVSSKRSSPTPAAGAFTSANVLVLYIGPVEIPEAWSVRELSSRCLQECTRRLLSQRQEFIEAFLDVNPTSLRILNVSQTPLFKHKREELYYCGVCTNDEQYFGIVTRKLQSKSGKKSSSSGQVVRAHMCHVFKVIQTKSVLVLHSGDASKQQRSRTSPPQVKPKTIPITSSVTIINALQGLFTGEAVSGSKLFDQSPPTRSSDPNLRGISSIQSAGSSSGGSSDSVYPPSPEKSKKKKLDVVDLRPSAFTSSPSHILTSTPTGGYSNPNTYVSFNSPSSRSPTSSRSQTKDYPATMGTPAYNQKSTTSDSWYSVDSPKENHHSRSGSWDSKGVSPVGHSHGSGSSSGGRKSNSLGKHHGLHFDQAKRMSDDSSMSSLSDSCTTSPSKSFRSSFASRSRSPTPPQSLSYSSGSRSRSPSPIQRKIPSPNPMMMKQTRFTTPSMSKLSAGLALEVSSIRSGVGMMSPYHTPGRGRPSLRRQGSETSVMELQEQIASPYHTSLPPKNGPMTSSIGSVATLTTVADGGAEDPEECGRVGGWVASFDKLLADPLGVQSLLQFLEKEHCEENILFWRDAQDFKEKAPQNNISEINSKVKKIYDQYLSSSSPHTVNIDDRVLKSIESRLSNPPLNIFSEAQEQIYQLMKMDCYPRFKKSDLVKECLLAEMTGKPLPIETAPQQKPQESQYTGIWKKHREVGFGRSLFGRWGRNRQQHQQALSSGIWGVSPEGKKAEPHLETKKGSKRGHKEESPRSRKSGTLRDGKHKHVREQPSEKASSPAEEFPPEDHLNIFQIHKRNVFEVNLPNKVTKIMEVPPKGTVRDAIQPVLKKHGYTFDIMELRFANTFKLIQLNSPAHILIGQHIIVTKSKNTFIAAFPDVLERILPADGLKTVGHLFAEVLQEIGKLQNFAIYLEGSRVPLELDVDTSVLVGQKVYVKYLPGPCTIKVPVSSSHSADSSPGLSAKVSKSSLGSSNGSNGKGEMDDLISMIQRLAGDKLDDQRISPEPGCSDPRSSNDDLHMGHGKRSPSDMRHRSSTLDSHRKRRSDGHERSSNSHKPLSSSKSNEPPYNGHHQHHGHHHHHRGKSPGSRERESRSADRQKPERFLKPPGGSSPKFGRTQSGSSISHHTTKPPKIAVRSLSPPPVVGGHYDYDPRDRSNTSPPPPTSKPPPLPSNAKRLSGSRRMASNARWSGTSLKSTDSASSEESIEGIRHYNYGVVGSDHIYMNRDMRANNVDQPKFFPRAHPSGSGDGPPIYVNSGGVQQERSKSYQRSRPGGSSKASSNSPPMPSPPTEYPHPLDNIVNEAYSNAPSSGSGSSTNHQRKPSWPSKQSHPLQTSRGPQSSSAQQLSLQNSRGPQSSSAQQLSSYPWHNAHSRRISAPPPRTAAQRRELTENPELVQAGSILVEREIEEYHSRHSVSDAGSSNSSEQLQTPLSPTTHTLILPEEMDPSDQRETFV